LIAWWNGVGCTSYFNDRVINFRGNGYCFMGSLSVALRVNTLSSRLFLGTSNVEVLWLEIMGLCIGFFLVPIAAIKINTIKLTAMISINVVKVFSYLGILGYINQGAVDWVPVRYKYFLNIIIGKKKRWRVPSLNYAPCLGFNEVFHSFRYFL
jgi:hypothetical protein